MPLRKAAENLGISESALKNWMKSSKEHEGVVPTRGSGNYASDEAKEIARLQRELRDTKAVSYTHLVEVRSLSNGSKICFINS